MWLYKGTRRLQLNNAMRATFDFTRLIGMEELPKEQRMNNYVTFLAGIFRSVRFRASSAHGKANMDRFNFSASRGPSGTTARSTPCDCRWSTAPC